MSAATLKSIEDIRNFFAANSTPIYFISATNFNLLGMDEWIGNFKFISHIDCFEGAHPNLFSPKKEMPHEEFQSIEDINNYLLSHPEVIEYIRSRSVNGRAGKALFLMFDEKTELLASQLGLEVCFPSAKLRSFLDNKVNTNRIAEKAGVACVPYVLSPVTSYSQLKEVSAKLGDDLVIQTPYGDSGHTTFFISNELDFKKYEEEIVKEKEVKIMKRINCYGTAIEGCVTRHGTLVAPLMTELVGFRELTPYKGGWCGNEIFPDAFTPHFRESAMKFTRQFGDQLRKEGYKGYFELDFLIDKDSGEIYLGELNPRISGVSSLTNHSKFAMTDVPLFLFHMLEWLNVPYEINADEMNNRWSKAENMDSWSQLIIKHTRKSLELAIKAPESGIWEMKKNGNIVYKKMDLHRQSVVEDNEAFYLQITQKDGYLYEGADLGILVMRGRQMSGDFQISERAKRWIRAIRSHYRSHIIDPGVLDENDILEADGFKML
jgi:carbamoylphosphate synthase large subunit